MFFRELLRPLLWQEQKNWGLYNIIDLMDYDGVYLPITSFNLPFDRTFSFDLNHSSTTLDHPIFDVLGGSYEVTDVVGHASGGMSVH